MPVPQKRLKNRQDACSIILVGWASCPPSNTQKQASCLFDNFCIYRTTGVILAPQTKVPFLLRGLAGLVVVAPLVLV